MKQALYLTMLIALSALLATGCRKMEFVAPPATMEISKQVINGDTCSLLENVSKTAAAKATGRSLVATTLTIFVDANGQANVNGSPWGIQGTFNCPNPGISVGKLDSMMKMTIEDYGYWEIVFVYNENDFQSASYPRVRAIVTNTTAKMLTSTILSGVSGVAYQSSVWWNDDTPCFIFANKITGSDKYKKIAEIVSHELGHTLGIPHQSESDGTECGFLGDYKHPSGDLQNGSIMGQPSQARFTRWIIGKSVALACGAVLNDVEIISSVVVLKEEPYCDALNNATPVLTSSTINTVLVHAENQHAFLKTGNGTKTLKIVSKGNLNAKVAVYSSPTAVPVIYDDPLSGNITIPITGKKWIRVFTTQPDNFPPSPVGGGYSIKLQ